MSSLNTIQQFQFPIQTQNFTNIKDYAAFKTQLKRQNNMQMKNVYYDATTLTESDRIQIMNLTCKQCNAFFKYIKINKEEYYLSDYNHKHRHQLKQKHSQQDTILQKMEKFILGLIQKPYHIFKADIVITHKISEVEFNQMYTSTQERVRNTNQLFDGKEIQQLIRKLKVQKFTILSDCMTSRLEREGKVITKSVCIINQQMEKRYKKYGDCCWLAIQQKNTINRWHAAALMGVGRDMQPCLLCFFLVKTIDVDHLKGMLKTYFKKVDHKPLTIKTQKTPYIDECLMQLSQQGVLQSNHVYDYTIFIDKNIRSTPQIKKVFNQICRQPIKQKFNTLLFQLKNNHYMKQIELYMMNLMEYAEKLCFSQIPSTPVGPCRMIKNKVSGNKVEFSLIKNFQKIGQQSQCIKGIHLYSKVINYINKLSNSITDEFSQKNRFTSKFPQLSTIRTKIHKNVMDYLATLSWKGTQLRSKKINDQLYQVWYSRKQYFFVNKNNQKWNCQCQQSVKTMLPCVHQMYVALKTRSSFDVQLGRRWTNQDEIMQKQRQKRSYTRKKNKRATLQQFLA